MYDLRELGDGIKDTGSQGALGGSGDNLGIRNDYIHLFVHGNGTVGRAVVMVHDAHGGGGDAGGDRSRDANQIQIGEGCGAFCQIQAFAAADAQNNGAAQFLRFLLIGVCPAAGAGTGMDAHNRGNPGGRKAVMHQIHHQGGGGGAANHEGLSTQAGDFLG